MRKKVGENRKIRQAFHHHNVFAHENASHLAHHLLQGAEKWIPNYQISERRLAELDAPVGHKFFLHFFHGWSGNSVRTRRNLLHTICSSTNLTKNIYDGHSTRLVNIRIMVIDRTIKLDTACMEREKQQKFIFDFANFIDFVDLSIL